MKREKFLISVSQLLAVIMLFSVFAAPVAQATVQLVTTATLTKLGDNSYQATLSVRNNGTDMAQEVVVSTASLGSAAGTPAPQAVGNIPAGAVASTVLNFPASAGASGAAVIEHFSGSYGGGTFVGSLRAVLPQLSANMVQLIQLIGQAQALEAGNTEFPIQVSNTSDGSDVNKAWPWVFAAERQALDAAITVAQQCTP